MFFTYQNPTKIIFGQGQISSLKKNINKNSKILFAYGGGSIKNNGIYSQVIDALDGYSFYEFSGIEPNPSIETLDKAVELIKQENIDFILAVGGGSVIDGCKYIAAAAKYEGTGWDLLTGTRTTDALPLGAIVTLPATGSESNSGAVISKKSTNEKLPLFSPLLAPKFAILDPDAVLSLPQVQIANGIVDAFVHVCEQYLTYQTGAMIQDGYSETILKTLINLGNTISEYESLEWRANLMWAANQALNGMIGSGVPMDWATHMIGHEITAIFGPAHARSLAMIQPHLLRNQIDNKKDKLTQMGQNVFGLSNDETIASKTIDEIESFYRKLGFETSFFDYAGSKDEAIDSVIESLEKHYMIKLGEKQQVDLDTSREILEKVFAN